MKRTTLAWLGAATLGSLVSPFGSLTRTWCGPTPAARAGEADDLQVMIDRSRRNVSDLQRIDEQRVASEELAVFSTWLDEAWRLRAEKQYDRVREVLDRGDAQADMIREVITAGQLAEQARQEESALASTRARIVELTQTIETLKKRKAALEATTR
ncbi:MAG: hypothetical protein KA712_15710 [Myxococcales bacterium]|nr:hypothetical protein [Myxococcales bacterium]